MALLEEQETIVADLAREEVRTDTVLTKETLHWFANSIFQRDDGGGGTIT